MAQGKIGLIVNPASGRGLSLKAAPRIVARLQDLDSKGIECYVSSRPGDGLREVTLKALQDDVKTLVICGGDGTVSEVVHYLFEQKAEKSVRIAHIPFGTCSDLALPLGIPMSVDSALDVIAEGTTRPLDVWNVEVETNKGGTALRHFVNIAGVGYTSLCVQKARNLPKFIHGMNRYLVSSALVFPTWRNAMMSIQLDNGPTKIKGSFFNINFCNGPQNGCGIRWSPTASLFDGKININMIGDLSKGALLGELGRLSRARQLPENHPFVRDVLATSVILESSRSIPVECDGDVIGLTPCQFTKARNTIDVVVSPTLKSQSKAQSD